MAIVALTIAACASEDEIFFPVRAAPRSRHDALVEALVDDARAYGFTNGDWDEDLGDAPFYGLAWLARRAESGTLDADGVARRDAAIAHGKTLLQGDLLQGDVEQKVMGALGLIEHVSASRDRSALPLLDDFVDRLDSFTHAADDYIEANPDLEGALRTYGPTAVMAVVALVEAQYALLVGGERAGERRARAIALDAKIREKALTDLVDVPTGRQGRAYAFAPGLPGLVDYPNLAMLLLKTRLFRLTKQEDFRLEARAIFSALQPLKLSDAPARYSSPGARAALGLDTRNFSTLPSQNYMTLGLLFLFEITGDRRFVDEADRLLDGIAAMRGPWCLSNVHALPACASNCASGQACVAGACSDDRCATGLLDHVIDGRLAAPEDGTLFCSGCNLQTLYVTGYRRALAGEKY